MLMTNAANIEKTFCPLSPKKIFIEVDVTGDSKEASLTQMPGAFNRAGRHSIGQACYHKLLLKMPGHSLWVGYLWVGYLWVGYLRMVYGW